MTNILQYSIENLLVEMKLKNLLVDYHYEVNNEYHNVDDILDEEEMVSMITDMLDEAYGENEQYNHLVAGILYTAVKDDVIEEIYERDDNASDYENDKWETYNRTTLPR